MLQNKAADKFSIFFPWIITNLHMNQWFDCYLEVWNLKAGN